MKLRFLPVVLLLCTSRLVNAQDQGEDLLLTVLGTSIARGAIDLEAQPSLAAIDAIHEQYPNGPPHRWRECYAIHPLVEAIQGPILEKYIRDNDLEPNEDDIADFVERIRALPPELRLSITNTPKLSDEEREEEKDYANMLLSQWKLQKSLFEDYGGRVADTDLGPIAIDAYYAYFRDSEEKGLFTIHDEASRVLFWQCFTNHSEKYYPSEKGKATLYEHPAEARRKAIINIMKEKKWIPTNTSAAQRQL